MPYFGTGSTADNGIFLAAFNAFDSSPDGKISQSFATALVHTYRVDFDFGTTTGGPQSLDVGVLGFNGIFTSVLTEQKVTASPPSALTHFSFKFMANGSQATLLFSDPATNSSFELDGVLDNVSVSATPEPSSLTLLGIGSRRAWLRPATTEASGVNPARRPAL